MPWTLSASLHHNDCVGRYRVGGCGADGLVFADGGHVKETLKHAKEGFEHEKEAIKYLKESVRASKDSHAKEALEHVEEAVKNADDLSRMRSRQGRWESQK